MSDFESSLQRWILVVLVLMTIALAGMNYWYKVLPEKAERERAANVEARLRQERIAKQATTASAPSPAIAPSAAHARQPDAPPRKTDIENLSLTLPDGRILGFEKTEPPANRIDDWSAPDRINPWLLVPETRVRSELPAIPSQRDRFIPLLLADGRLALIGGNTPRDVVALEKKCPDCADEYVPFGDATPSKTSDVFDFEAGTWSSGPVAAHTADAALALRDGRVFQVNLEQVPGNDQLTTRLRVEITDDRFTRWQRAGEILASMYLSEAKVFESRNGVVLLLAGSEGPRAYHWAGRGKLKPWLEGENWVAVEQLDEGHLQLTQRLDLYTPRSKKLIVELP